MRPFAAICTAVRAWALAHPNEYALIYGSPVPGYVAPADTVRPASRVTTLLLRIIVEAAAAGRKIDPCDRVGVRVIAFGHAGDHVVEIATTLGVDAQP